MSSELIRQFVIKQRELLQFELDSELNQLKYCLESHSAKSCQDNGFSLLHLEVKNIRSSLFSRFVIELSRLDNQQLPAGFKVNDEIEVFSTIVSSNKNNENMEPLSGIVTKITPKDIEISVDEIQDTHQRFLSCPPLRINKRASEVTHKKLLDTLNKLLDPKYYNHPVINLVFSESKQHIKVPQVIPLETISKHKKYMCNLCKVNNSQKLAIESILSPQNHISLIHGPPGTGKSTTLVEFIIHTVQMTSPINGEKSKLLVCAPSNTAVDLLLSAVTSHPLAKDINCLRLGHPSRIGNDVLNHCLDSKIFNHESNEIVEDIRKEITVLKDKLFTVKEKSKKVNSKFSRAEAYQELKLLRSDQRKYEKRIVSELLQSTNVVFATCIGSSSSLLKDIIFDITIIDEAAQALEIETWVPILKSEKVVLAGDHCQLPATVKSAEAEKQGLAVSLFEKLILDNTRFQSVVHLLDTQYRMNQTICNWASLAMYNDTLKCYEAVKSRTLLDYLNDLKVHCNEKAIASFSLIDMSGCASEDEIIQEKRITNTKSHSNREEANLVCKYAKSLLNLGVKALDIGIITPYSGQVNLIRQLLHDDTSRDSQELSSISVRTVDGFQGGEKEVIIISMVRSNNKREVGFLADCRRINVAVTRAKSHVAIFANVDTCSSNSFILNLLNYAELNGDYRSGMELLSLEEDYISLEFESPICCLDDSPKQQPSQQPILLRVSDTTRKSFVKDPKKKTGKIHRNEVMLEAIHISEDVSKKNESFEKLVQNILIKFDKNEILSDEDKKICNIEYRAGNSTLIFSKSLSNYERKVIHEQCDIIKSLHHFSEGEQYARQVKVEKIESTVKSVDVISSIQSIKKETPMTSQNEIRCSASKQKKKVVMQDVNEDALLSQAILENVKYQRDTQYRIGSTPMPNPEKEMTKSKLNNRIKEAQLNRKSVNKPKK